MSKNKGKQYFQGKECFSRMNFLFQASLLMAGRNNVLASYYGELCRNVGKKAVLRIDPEVKRSLCKRCSLAQRPGSTADLCVSSMAQRQPRNGNIAVDDNAQLQLQCRLCGYQRNFNVNPNYKFWLEHPASVAEVTTVSKEKLTASTAVSNAPKRKCAENSHDRDENDKQRKAVAIVDEDISK